MLVITKILTLNPIYVCNPSTKNYKKNLFLLNELRIYETTTLFDVMKSKLPKTKKY